MLGWILSFYIFFTYFNIRVNRYIIPAIPPIIYFIMLSIELIHEKITINKKYNSISFNYNVCNSRICFLHQLTKTFQILKVLKKYQIT